MAEPLAPGTASHAADAEAKAAVRTPEFRQAAAQAHGTVAEEPAREREEEVEHPADPDEGPSPSTAPTGDDGDEPEVEDDYEEEDHAVTSEEEPEADRPKTTDVQPAADPAADDIEKTWAQYKTEAERKKALAENKKYGIEQADRAKALQAELDALKSGKATEAAPAPKALPPAGARATLERLYNANPQVRQAVDTLGQHRERLVARTTDLKALTDQISTGEAAIVKLQHLIDYLTEEAKADPENYELTRKIDAFSRERDRIETTLNRDQARQTRMELEKDRWLGEYNEGVRNINEYATREQGRASEEAKADASFKADTDRAATEWDKAHASVMDELKIPAGLRDKIGYRLLEAANSFYRINPGTQIDIRAWMLDRAKKINDDEYKIVRDEATRGYVRAKTRDAASPAPKGPAAAAPLRQKDRLSSRDADRQARDQMKAVRIR